MEKLGASHFSNQLYQPLKFSCHMKIWNLGQFLHSEQSSRTCSLIQRAPVAANQMYLIKREGNINADCSLPFPPLEERKITYKVPIQPLWDGIGLQRAIPTNHPIPASPFPMWASYNTGRYTLRWIKVACGDVLPHQTVDPTTQWRVELDPRDVGTVSLHVFSHAVVIAVDLFVDLSIFWKEK